MNKPPKVYPVKTKRGTQYRVLGYVRGVRKYLGQWDTREEAERKAKALSRHTGRKGRTLEDFSEQWFDEREQSGRYKNVPKERNLWKNHVEGSGLSHMEMRNIQRHHVKHWIDEKIKTRRWSRQTIRHARNIVRVCLDGAFDKGMIKSNPSVGIRIHWPVDVSEDDKWDFLRPHEVQQILDLPVAKYGEDLRTGSNEIKRVLRCDQKAFVAMAIFTGLRKGELCGLKWEDIELERDIPRLRVRRSYNTATKTLASMRTIPIFDEAMGPLLDWKNHGEVSRAFGFVWPSDDGSCRRSGSHALGWSRVKKLVKFGRRVRFHDLRHTFGTSLRQGLWGNGVSWNLEEIRRAMGHTDIKMTARYARFGPDYIEQVAAEKVGFVNNNLLTDKNTEQKDST